MMDDKTLKQLIHDYNLLQDIVQQPRPGQTLKADLSKVGKLIQTTIPETLKKNAPDNFYELYTDFQAEYDKFRDFILYDQLIGKNVVALGGGFSSGKSSFLNALMDGQRALPVDIDPSTSVPTYIVQGKGYDVTGVNVFDAVVHMVPRDLPKIAHGFGKVESEGGVLSGAVTLGHVLESLFLATPKNRYANIAFLDTPGYSKPDAKDYSAKTDADIARRQLNGSSYILWFVQADAGTITQADIEFIQKLRKEIPKCVILNKADKKTEDDLKAIKEKISQDLTYAGIQVEGVYAFSDRTDRLADEKQKAFLEAEKKEIQKQLNAWNEEVREVDFARHFKALFFHCRKFYEKEIKEQSLELSLLNKSLTLLEGDHIEVIQDSLHRVIKYTADDIKASKAMKDETEKLQLEFFTEIKRIADQVGIEMPEPSDIDLIADEAEDPLAQLEAYQKKAGIKTDPELEEFLKAAFAKVRPVLKQKEEENDQGKQILQTLRGLCQVKRQDVKFLR